MIKGYSFDIEINERKNEVDEEFLIKVIGKALKKKRISLLGISYQTSWENNDDYAKNIQC